MNKHQRINKIRIQLLTEKRVTVAELAHQLAVSERTVRRDLKELADNGIASLFFGGAELINVGSSERFQEAGIKTIMSNLAIPDEQISSSTQVNHTDVYVLGSFNIDIVSEVDLFPKRGETIHSLSTGFYPGGKGSNQATAASKVSKAVHFTTKIGQDEFGQKAKNYLASTDINSFNTLEDPEQPTGNAMIMVELQSGENIITIDLGANSTIMEDELTNEFAHIHDSKVFLTQLENNFDITKMALEYARRSPALVMLNPAPYRSEVSEIVHLVDIITPNETEAESLTGITIEGLASARLAAERLFEMGPKAVIITLGAKGCLYYNGERHQEFKPFKAVVTDTSGAGDSFNGSLAACIAQGHTIEYSIRYANAFASLAVERKGAANMPSAELVEARLSQQEF
ncbi:PfkB family carbohydrate kinase [Vibrio maerlii]|uniref:PfkB family carbohydrate kinase n=1 Tax=Vibrio maerlii TaxID=2231648 RepID=UPI000E3EA875|nr:PfkB family carbohydrate kinase [Vibrio maerlii]